MTMNGTVSCQPSVIPTSSGAIPQFRSVISVKDYEKSLLFPFPLWDQLHEVVPGMKHVPLEATTDWEALFEDFQPELVVTCWRTPRLPDKAPPSLRYVCHLTGSVRGVVPRSYLEHGIQLSNWGNAISDTVAEGALLLVLSCLRRMTYWTLQMHQRRRWREEGSPLRQSLFEKRVGIHGFGNVARCLASLLRPFSPEIYAYSHGVPEDLFAKHGVIRCEGLDDLFSRSQIVVEVEADTPETHGSVREHHLRLLPPDGIFVNVGRAGVVDNDALIRVAKEGQLGIGLDVFVQEPLEADSPLRGLQNVVLTPHVAGPTDDRSICIGRMALLNLRNYLEGQPLESPVCLSTYDRLT